jgi:hypothetical protein
MTLRAGSGRLDGGDHEGKRREEKKENILLAWKVSQVRTVDACKYRHEASAMACWVRMKVGRCLVALLNLSFTSNLNPLGLER